MAKDDRDTQKMDVVLPPQAEQPVVRHFHYTTDPGVQTDPDKELIRGLRRDTAEDRRDNLSALLDEVEKDIEPPAPTPIEEKLSDSWTVPSLPRNRRGLMLMIYGGVIATVLLAAIVIIGKALQSHPAAPVATSIAASAPTPLTVVVPTLSTVDPTPIVSAAPTPPTPMVKTAPRTSTSAAPTTSTTAPPKPSATTAPTSNDSLMKPEI